MLYEMARSLGARKRTVEFKQRSVKDHTQRALRCRARADSMAMMGGRVLSCESCCGKSLGEFGTGRLQSCLTGRFFSRSRSISRVWSCGCFRGSDDES